MIKIILANYISPCFPWNTSDFFCFLLADVPEEPVPADVPEEPVPADVPEEPVPEDPMTFCSQGDDSSKKGDYGSAVESYTKAIALDDGNAVYYGRRYLIDFLKECFSRLYPKL